MAVKDKISRDVKHQLYLALPPERLIKLANTFGFAKKAGTHAELARLLAEAADMVALTFINSHLYFLEPRELKSIAKKVSVGKGVHNLEALAYEVELFIRQKGSSEPAAGVIGENGISIAELWEEANRLAKSTIYLKAIARPKRSQPKAAIWNQQTIKVDGREHWLAVDLRHHPDESLREEGILHVYANWGEEGGVAELVRGKLPLAKKGQMILHAVQERDFPSSEVLMLKATKRVKKWRDQIGWEPETGQAMDAAALTEYDAEWGEIHPSQQFHGGDIYAQLGGWPISWPEESAAEQIRRKLVLRTYENSEPWLEIFRRGKTYEVVSRIS